MFAIYITFTNILSDGTESHSMGGVLLSFCFPSLALLAGLHGRLVAFAYHAICG